MRQLVPLLEDRQILETKVCGEINNFHARSNEFGRIGHRHAMRRRVEHHVRLGQIGGRRIAENEITAPAQTGEHGIKARTRFFARGDHRQLRVGMQREYAQQFYAGVACAADDAYFDLLVRVHSGNPLFFVSG